MSSLSRSGMVEDGYIYNTFTEWDTCCGCEVYRVKYVCQHCGDGVCRRNICCQIFPHKNDQKFVICNNCTNTIDEKLMLVINYNDLYLLKKKIRAKLTRTIKNIEEEYKKDEG